MKIRALIMDVDGTLTDGRLYMSSSAEIMKVFNVKDGYGIKNILPTLDIVPVVITGRMCATTAARCAELGIRDVYQGVQDKIDALHDALEKYDLPLDAVAYIGDDENDMGCMEMVARARGVVGCPSDSTQRVIEIADYVTKRRGGEGAVREFIDYLSAV